MPSTVIWSASFTGTPSSDDIAAANAAIEHHNEQARNASPPEPELPNSNAAERKASAEILASEAVTNFWQAWIGRAGRGKFEQYTPIERQSIMAAIKVADLPASQLITKITT